MLKSLSAVLLGLTASGLVAVASAQAEDISLRLPWLLNVQSAGYVMAKEKGFYSAEGLNVTIQPGGPNLNSTALVASGANTFGTNDTNGVILGASQGMDLDIVAACFQKNPGGVVARADTGIKTPADLKGKTLAYTEGGPWTLTKAMLDKEGVPLDSLHLVVSPSQQLLIDKKVDAETAFAINEPIALALHGVKSNVILPADYGVHSYAEAIFTTHKYVKDHPDVVAKFVKATIKGYDYAYAHQDETVKAVVALNNQLDPKQQAEQLKAQVPYVYTDFTKQNGTCAFQGSVIADTVDILKKYGGLKTEIDPTTLYTTQFIPSAK